MPSRAVVWFRGALRVTDRPALLAALDAGDQVVPVFVVDRALLDGRPSGGGESRGSGPGGRVPGAGPRVGGYRGTGALGSWVPEDRVPEDRVLGSSVPGSSVPGGLWAAGSPNSGDGLRSPTGGDSAPDRGSSAWADPAREDPAPEEGARVRRRTGWVRRGWTPRRPYYRIVNPVTQAEKFDPTATTSVTGSPSSPSAGPGDLRPLAGQPRDLEAAGVRLGRDYPRPIVDHTTARNHALARSQEATSRRS